MARRLFALSIDLDAFDLYLGLHGLERLRLEERALAAVPARAAERFGELCACLGVKGTAFVVGRDLARGRGEDELALLHRAGHELASHSFAHDYALSRRDPQAIDDDLARAEAQLERLTGRKPLGFRAPGYTLSTRLVELLRARGYLYDSSLLPSPPYYAAKAAVMGAMALAGRRSRSILGNVGQLLRPRTPHVDHGVLELPVSVLPGLRVPYIGTLLTGLPAAVSEALARTLAHDELVVVELHGADLCDGSDGVPAELLARQRDLRIPAKIKLERLERVLRHLVAGRTPVTLAGAARLLSGASSA